MRTRVEKRGRTAGGLRPQRLELLDDASNAAALEVSTRCPESLRGGSVAGRHAPRAFMLLPLLILSFFCGSAVLAQITLTNVNTSDPLMRLMQSQPSIDINAPVMPSARFDPPVVRPGQLAVYRVTLNALVDSVVGLPESLPGPEELESEQTSSGQLFQLTGGSMVPFSAFNYRVRTEEEGAFVVPEMTIRVYGREVIIPSAQLAVSANLQPGSTEAKQLFLQIPTNDVYLGQAVTMRALAPGRAQNVVQGLREVKLEGEGFLVDQGGVRQTIQQTSVNGRNVAAYIYELPVIPILSGELELRASGFTAGNQFGGQVVITGQAVIPGGPPVVELLDSTPETLKVKPLPREGELAGFSGAIGRFEVLQPRLNVGSVRVGEPVELSVFVRGEGNVTRLVPPSPPIVRDWQVFSARASLTNLPVVFDPASGRMPMLGPTRLFTFTLVPLSARVKQTPAIPFSSFDPELGEYVDLTIPPVPTEVLPAEGAGDQAILAGAGSAREERVDRPVLSGLAQSRGRTVNSLVPVQQRAWFPLMQIAPALLFGGLWCWDRRRRFLERHPEIVRRRRARRALRREQRGLARAARRNDAREFCQRAVNAMRVATAPHYPAEPRALVGVDVLRVLDDTALNNGETELVRRFFGSADASRFAEKGEDLRGLLKLRPELERLLNRLEERL